MNRNGLEAIANEGRHLGCDTQEIQHFQDVYRNKIVEYWTKMTVPEGIEAKLQFADYARMYAHAATSEYMRQYIDNEQTNLGI